ncbi:MAG: DEAD/DEAH box helicase [Bacteroidales bacterium]|nr:DEAD/DEAH box helicase [Bacteroidales bacterium]
MEEKFVVTLSEHRTLGHILIPYIVQKQNDKEFYSIKDRLTHAKKKHYDDLLGQAELDIIKQVEEYNDAELLRVFSKKKMSSNDFIRTLDKELLEKHVRPYIERRIYKCLEVISAHSIPLFDKRLNQSIFESDRISHFREKAHAIFNFELHDEGLHYYLTMLQGNEEMKLNSKEAIYLTNQPCSLILDYHLYVFSDIDSKKLQPFFSKEYVKVEKQHLNKYLNSFVKNAIQNYPVKTKGFEVIQAEIIPQPIISVEKNMDEKYVFVLKFKYGEKHAYFAQKKTETLVELIKNNDRLYFQSIKRKYNLETETISTLIDLGLVSERNNAFFTIKDSGGEVSTLINWLNSNEKELKEAGFIIDQEFLDIKYFTGEIKLHFSISTAQNDWFDVHATVEFGEFMIPFSKLRKNIINSNPEYVLPNGEVAILPKEWFARYRELFLFSEDKKDILGIKKQHFSLINESFEGIDPEQLKKLTSLFDSKDSTIDLPVGIKAELRPYQHDGFCWMEKMRQNNLNVCLADDMGLGKTLQTLTLLQYAINNDAEKNEVKQEKPVVRQLNLFDAPVTQVKNRTFVPATLIVVPRSLIHNWTNEILKFAPNLSILHFIGNNRGKNYELFNQYNVIITTYGIVRNEVDFLQGYRFFYIVLDESQVIKNPESKAYQAVNELDSDYKLVLTGTPLENTLTDLWSQLNFLNRGLLGNLNFFRREFVIPIEKQNDEKVREKLQKIIQPFILRRTKQEVAKDLPDLLEQVLYCDMSEDQKRIYDEEKSRIRNVILENIEQNGLERSSIVVLQGLTKLRQLSNHPVLINESYGSDSGKFDEIINRLENLAAEKHKVLIFSSFVKHLNLFASYFEENDYTYSMLTGSTKYREEEINKFQKTADNFFFLISLKAGGVGLNLTAADYVFILDPWWNPAVENQAISRAHRIGQKSNVFVYRFISKESIEEKIIRLQERKSALADLFVNENNPFRNLTADDIKELFD